MKPTHRHKNNLSLKGLAKTLVRQVLVAVSEDLPETHSNIEQIWSLINANGLKLILACDMKVANIICGLQTHSIMHPCT